MRYDPPSMSRLFPLTACLSAILTSALPLSAQQEEAEKAPVKAPDKATLQSAEAWAKQFEAALHNDQPGEVEVLLEVDMFLEALLNGIKVKDNKVLEGFRKDMRLELERNPELFGSSLWTACVSSQPKFKKILVVDGKPTARFRLTGDDGITFFDLRLVQRGDTWRLYDYYNHALGLSFLDLIRSTAMLALKGLDAGILARLFGAPYLSAKDLSRLTDMMTKIRQEDFQGAVAIHSRITEGFKKTSLITTVHLTALARIESENDAYAQALEDAARRFPAPKFRLMLVDAHILKERWDAAIASLDEVIKAIGRDAALLATRSWILVQDGRTAEAIADINEAMTLEPDCEYMWLTGLEAWLAAEDYKAVAKAITKLEETGNYDYKGVLVEELWAGFRAAPESKPWR